jgi:hypothetical protein
VTPPDVSDPIRTGGFSPLTMCYPEVLSAGARLLGVRRASGEYEALLPRDAILEAIFAWTLGLSGSEWS